MSGVVQILKKEHGRLTKELQGISAALAAFGKTYGNRSRLLAAARARIAAAQRARWAKVRAGNKGNVVTMPKKRALSAAGRKRIAAAQKARWSKVKAAKKA